MTYEVIILGHLHMPLYFIGTFTEYPLIKGDSLILSIPEKSCCYAKHNNRKELGTVRFSFLFMCIS